MLQKPLIVTVIPATPAVPAQAEMHECTFFEEGPEGGGPGEEPPEEPSGEYYEPTPGETILSWNGSYFADSVAPPNTGDVCAIHGTDPFNVTPYPTQSGTAWGGVICGPQAVVDLYI